MCHHFPTFQLFFVFLAIANLPFSTCDIKHVNVVDDSRPFILLDRLGLTKDGHVEVLVHNVSYKSTHPISSVNPSLMGFFLVSNSFSEILKQFKPTDKFCIFSSNYVNTIFKFSDLRNDFRWFNVTKIDVPAEYSLIFGNCQPEYRVSMTVASMMYNWYNGRENFLPAGQIPVPIIYSFLFHIYLLFIVIWVFLCVKNRTNVHKIHILMFALLLFKTLNLFSVVSEKTLIMITGDSQGWDEQFYIFKFFKGMLVLIVIVLIGTGWSILKPFLQDQEKKILMMVIPLQVIVNIGYVVLQEADTTKMDITAWHRFLILIDVACCFVVILPVIWSIRRLRDHSFKLDGKLARNLEMLSDFKQFYIAVSGYLFFTRILVPEIVGPFIGYGYEWVKPAAIEGATLCFYCFVFHICKPVKKKSILTH